ncbi:hypothetical protein [Gellertiella hungarica]|uniref:Uncharacterized protein n=1 Tax=Gellertiella hungarica TaxID=1572859 RepID=A0A7W6NMX5_9HYPH|nr:hypothetical protein [Gellertiella hungarica]MBB4066787.1 hypothetical protein [Gellertiella hungarica]
MPDKHIPDSRGRSVLPDETTGSPDAGLFAARFAEYTLISAIICLSLIALIGVNAYVALERVEAAYRIERV